MEDAIYVVRMVLFLLLILALTFLVASFFSHEGPDVVADAGVVTAWAWLAALVLAIPNFVLWRVSVATERRYTGLGRNA